MITVFKLIQVHIMPSEKVKVNVRERLEDDTLDLSLSEITEVPVKEIVNISIRIILYQTNLISFLLYFQIACRRATILDLSSNKIIYLGVIYKVKNSNFK